MKFSLSGISDIIASALRYRRTGMWHLHSFRHYQNGACQTPQSQSNLETWLACPRPLLRNMSEVGIVKEDRTRQKESNRD